MAQHTTGPWINTGGISGTGGRLVGAYPDSGLAFTVARAELPPFGPDREGEREANALLIAAAPQLLEACRVMYSRLAELDPRDVAHHLNGVSYRPQDFARCVIAKATPEQPECDGCYKNPCECLPANASCDPEQ